MSVTKHHHHQTKKKLEENVHGCLVERPVLAANFNTGGIRTRGGKRPRPRSRSLKSLIAAIFLGENKALFLLHENTKMLKKKPGPWATTAAMPGPPIQQVSASIDRGLGQEMKIKSSETKRGRLGSQSTVKNSN